MKKAYLLDFTVGNFRSIGEQITLSMERIKKLREKTLDTTNVIKVPGTKTELLKSAVIYGANASGKSNLLRALGRMCDLVKNSSKESQSGEPLSYDPFAFSKKFPDRPTFFEVRFFIDHSVCRYGFEYRKRAIVQEWLICDKNEVFRREAKNIVVHPDFAAMKRVADDFPPRSNTLLLSLCAQLNVDVATNIVDSFFNNIISLGGVCEMCLQKFSPQKYKQENLLAPLVTLLREIDTGITDLQIKKSDLSEDEHWKAIPSKIRDRMRNKGNAFSVKMFAVHSVENHDYSLNFRDESDGTHKFSTIVGPLLDSLKSGRLLLIDELEARLHPNLVDYIVRLFNQYPSGNAQLVFTTHDSNLLSADLFRRDQIWFTEKDPKTQQTELASFADFGIRQDASYEKLYLTGRMGGTPFIRHTNIDSITRLLDLQREGESNDAK